MLIVSSLAAMLTRESVRPPESDTTAPAAASAAEPSPGFETRLSLCCGDESEPGLANGPRGDDTSGSDRFGLAWGEPNADGRASGDDVTAMLPMSARAARRSSSCSSSEPSVPT